MGLMLGASSLFAQPGSVQKAAKSVFTLTTFNKDGNIISSTQGVFIDNKGTAIGTFKPFIGAVKATIVDASGKSMDVDAILGADELYDVAKFRVLGNTTAANIATAESPGAARFGSFLILSRNHLTSRRISQALRSLRKLTITTSSPTPYPTMQWVAHSSTKAVR